METCLKCNKETQPKYILKAIKSQCTDDEIQKKRYPKFGLMVKQICEHCGKYIRFSTQTQEVIELANRQAEDSAFSQKEKKFEFAPLFPEE